MAAVLIHQNDFSGVVTEVTELSKEHNGSIEKTVKYQTPYLVLTINFLNQDNQEAFISKLKKNQNVIVDA